MATELRKIGATVEEGAGLPSHHAARELRRRSIDTYDDHRMAMCFSLVALAGRAGHDQRPGCVRKTFPDYFDAFAAIARTS